MNAYAKYTPLRITAPFIMGVVAGISGENSDFAFIPFYATIGLTAAFCFFFFLFDSSYNWRWMAGVFAYAGLFFAGLSMLSASSGNDQVTSSGNGRRSDGMELIVCRMIENGLPGKNAVQAVALIFAYSDSSGFWHRCHEKAQFYFKGDSAGIPGPGSLFVANAALREPDPPANPDMFDYKQYLARQHIYRQSYLGPGQWMLLDSTGFGSMRKWAVKSRQGLLDIIRSSGIEGREFALAAALITGLKDHLEKDTRQEFAYAGAMHVLCVSGLHVGILFAVAEKLLFFLGRNRKSRQVRSIIIIIIIWSYAFITGLSPSVQRASLMFSLLAAGKLSRRETENFNILAVAAFVQLCLDPYAITSVGFQLSYLAVMGIFAFYKPMDAWLPSGNKAISWVWSVVSVSTAAQLATFPLACHYFNIFPVYFLLTNLVVVPLAAFIMYYAVFLIAAGSAGLAHLWLGWPLSGMLRLMSGSVEWIQSWPGAVIEPVVLSPAQVGLLYAVIISVFMMLVVRLRKWIFGLAGLLIIFSFNVFFIDYQRYKTFEITVYQIPGYTAIDFIHNRKAIFITDMDVAGGKAKIDYNIKPHRTNAGVRQVINIHPDSLIVVSLPGVYIHYPFILFHGIQVLIMDERAWPAAPVDFLRPDLLVLSVEYKNDQAVVFDSLPYGKIVGDASIPKYAVKQCLIMLEAKGHAAHMVSERGAFTLKW